MSSHMIQVAATPNEERGLATIGDVLDATYGTSPGALHRSTTAWVCTIRQSASVPVVLTFTTGGTPATYTTATGALTIADSTSVTVAELLKYCNELRGNIVQLQAILTAHGLSV